MTVCIHCNSPCRLIRSGEVYGRNHDHGWLWSCPRCSDSFVGCHPGTKDALGFAADSRTRKARNILHKDCIDPIWRNAPKKDRREARRAVYWFLSEAMSLDADECHVAMFDIEQCRQAWRLLSAEDVNYKTLIELMETT